MKKVIVGVALLVMGVASASAWPTPSARALPARAADQSTGAIAGRVTIQSGGGLAGVGIGVYNLSGNWVAGGSSDASGNYVVNGLAGGKYFLLTSNSQGYIDQSYENLTCYDGASCSVLNGTPVNVTAGATTPNINFALALGGRFGGRVTDSILGSGISGVWVAIHDANGVDVANRQTDATGNFLTQGLPPATYYAKTNNTAGYISKVFDNQQCLGCTVTTGTPIVVTAGATLPVNFALNQGGVVRGHITESGTGTPLIDNVWVDFFDAGGKHVGSSPWTDAAGAYTSCGLPAGTYYARTNSSRAHANKVYDNLPVWTSLAPATSVTPATPIVVTTGGVTSGVDFALDAGGRVMGRITDATTGLPVSGGVTAYDMSGHWMGGWGTDPAGYYALPGLPVGSYYLVTNNSAGYLNQAYNGVVCVNCSSTTGSPVAVTLGSTTTINFALNPGGRIAGRLTDAGTVQPITGPDIWVSFFDSTGRNLGGASPDATGNYITSFGLTAGTYYAQVDNRLGYINEAYDNVLCLACSATSGTPISVTSGTVTNNIDFALDRGGIVTGRITETGTGTPLTSDVWVGFFDATGRYLGASATLDAAGVYTSRRLPAGTYYARTDNRRYHANEVYSNLPVWTSITSGTPIVVTLGGTTSGVDFTLDTGGRIAGRITDATTGLPIPGSGATAYDASGRWMTALGTDAAGYYALAGVPAGNYYVITDNSLGYVNEAYDNVPCVNCSATTGTPVTVTVGATTPNINFALASGSRLHGTITAPGGAPIAGAWVDVFDATGRHLGSSSPSDGSGLWQSMPLSPGRYYARTNNNGGFINKAFDNLPSWTGNTQGTPIDVSGPAPVNGVNFVLDIGGQITGRVTAAATGAGIGGVWMEINDASGRWWGGATTDSSGNYNSTGLPAGTYYLRTNNVLGYANRMYANLPMQGDLRRGTPVQVTAGQATTGINFALAAGGRITGRVTDAATGQPISGINLSVIDSANEWVGGNNSDQQGNYTISVAPGTYKVRTNPSGLLYVNLVFNQQPCCDVTVGNNVVVTAGQITAGIDFALTHGGRIAGRLTDAGTGQPITGSDIWVNISDANGQNMGGASPDASGNYLTGFGLPAGTYYASTDNRLGYLNTRYNNLPNTGPVTNATPITVAAGATTAGIDFTVVPGGRISGRITEAGTGNPLAGVNVEVFNSVGEGLGWSETTDANGNYTTFGLTGGTYFVRTNGGHGHVNRLYPDLPFPTPVANGTPVAVVTGVTTPNINFVLVAGGTITGRISVQGAGTGLAGIGVTAYDAVWNGIAGASTDATGSYSLVGLPAGSVYVQTNNGQGYVDLLYPSVTCYDRVVCPIASGTPVPVVPRATTANINFALSMGGRFGGRVTDAGSGAGIPNVWVNIYDANGASVANRQTDATGTYITQGMPPAAYLAKTNNSSGYLDALHHAIPCPIQNCTVTAGTPITVTAGTTTPVDFGLVAGGRIAGRLTDASTGQPITGSDIWVNISDANGQNIGGAGPDASGNYVTPFGLPAGTYYATVDNRLGYINKRYNNLPFTGSATSGTPIIVAAGTTTTGIDFGLVAGGRIAGRLTDASTGQPITGSDIWVNVFDTTGRHLGNAGPDANGNYITSFGLTAGTYYARTDSRLGYVNKSYHNLPASGSVTGGTPIIVAAGATASGVDFALPMGGRMAGRVTDATTGLPVAGVGVTAYDASGQWTAGVRTDTAGDYTMPGVPAGSYYVITDNSLGYVNEAYNDVVCLNCAATTGATVAVTVGATTSNINFALSPGGRIAGRLTVAGTGQPITGNDIWVNVFDQTGRHLGGANPDATGNYILPFGLPAGTYYAQVDNRLGYINAAYPSVVCLACSATSGSPISVSLGAVTNNIDFALERGGIVTGRITDSSTGLPLTDNVWVDFYDTTARHMGSSATLDAMGVYTSRGLPTGTYYAGTNNQRYSVNEKYNNLPTWTSTTSGTPIVVTAGVTTPGVDFALDPGGRIAGRVTDATTGLPIAGVGVNVYDVSGHYMGGWNTDSAGFYALPGVPSGNYYVNISNSLSYIGEAYNDVPCVGCSSTTGTPVPVTVGATTSNIDFALNAGGSISGTVSAAGGGPLASQTVRIYNSSNSNIRTVTTNGSGVYTAVGLPTGTYYVRSANTLGYVDMLYTSTVCTAGTCNATTGTGVVVTAPQTTSSINLTLPVGGSITGTVTSAAGGAMLSGAIVRVYNTSNQQVASVTTNASGVYTASGLGTGTYYARTANTPAYVGQLYTNVACPNEYCTSTTGTGISVTQGQTTPNINFALATGGNVTGTVTAASGGAPLASVAVRFYNGANTQLGLASTNAQGVYTSTGLPSGTVFARTGNSSGYVDGLYSNKPCPLQNCTANTGTPITITSGATTSGIDFALATGGTISGTVTDAASSSGVANVSVRVFDGTNTQVGSFTTSASGTYSFTGLPSGSFYVKTATATGLGYIDQVYNGVPCPGGVCAAALGSAVSVTTGSTTSGINFALTRGATISGTVTGNGNPLASVTVAILDTNGLTVWSTSTSTAGVYTVSGLPTGTYFAQTTNAGNQGFANQVYNGAVCWSCTPIAIGTPISATALQTTPGINFALTSAGSISGTVREGTASLNAISVVLYSAGLRTSAGASTNASGFYNFAGLPPGSYFVQTSVSSTSGYVNQLYNGITCGGSGCTTATGTPVTVAAGQTVGNINFAMSRGGKISGSVVNGSTPVANVTVTATPSLSGSTASATTDAQGMYTISGLQSSAYYVKATGAAADGYVPQLYNGVPCLSCTSSTGTPVPVTSGQTTSGINFVLQRGVTLSGRVTDGVNGVANVSVTVYNALGAGISSATTDASGQYGVGGLTPGVYYARTTNASSLGFVEQLYHGQACPGGTCTVTTGAGISVTSSGAANIDFALTPGGQITGVVTTGGVAASSKTVRIFNGAGQQVGAPSSNSNGVYTLNGLPTGTYFARAFNSGFVDILYNGAPCPGAACNPLDGTPITVTAGGTSVASFNFSRAGATISGTVTGGGAPLGDVVVSLYPANSVGTSVSTVVTGGLGAYSFAGLSAGSYYLVTSNQMGFTDQIYGGLPCVMGYCDPVTGTPVTVSEGDTAANINFALAAGATIAGTVRNTASAPVGDVMVFAFTEHGGYAGYGYADPSGRYAIRGLPAGTYYASTSRAQLVGYQNQIFDGLPWLYNDVTTGSPIALLAGTVRSGIDFTLAAGGSVSGTVLDATTSQPLADVSVWLAETTGRRLLGAQTGANGGYVLRGIPAGDYLVHTDNQIGYQNQVFNGLSCPLWPCLAGATPVAVTLGAETGNVNFALQPGSRIEGHVTDAPSQAGIGSVEVFLFDQAGAVVGNARSDAAGHYVSNQGFAPGTYYARTNPFPGWAVQLYSNRACAGGICAATSGDPITVSAAPRTSGIDFALARCSTLTVGPTALGDALVHAPYSALFAAGGGTQPYSYSVAEVSGWVPTVPTPGSKATAGFRVARGVLPPGLSLNATTGALTGAPTAPGSYSFAIGAVDSAGCSASRLYYFFVGESPVTVTWPAPAPVAYGTPLGAVQLNATASVPGTFAYTPAAGTVLPVGTFTLSVVFTPTDGGTYPVVAAAAPITVTSTGPGTITVTSPNGGEHWFAGSAHDITWTWTGAIANVKLEASTDAGATWSSDSSILPNTGTFHVNIGNAAAGTQYLIRLSDASNAAVFDVSDAVFTVSTDTTEPNDTSATAATLQFGMTTNLLYGSDTDNDWYKFFVPPSAEGQDLRVNVRVLSEYPALPRPTNWRSDVDFELFDGSLRTLGVAISGSDNETLYLHNVASGWYYINVPYCTTAYADEEGIAYYGVTLEAGTGFGVGYISGRVVGGGGQGIGGVFVQTQLYPQDHNISFSRMTTNPDGTFSVADLPGTYIVLLDGKDSMTNRMVVNVVSKSLTDRPVVSAGQTADLGTIPMDIGAIVTGRVTDPVGAGLSSASVLSYDSTGVSRSSVSTGSDGTYTLLGVPIGGAVIRASGSSYAAEYYDNQPSQGTATVLATQSGVTIPGIDIQLGTGGTVSGYVRDSQGFGIVVSVQLFSVLDSTFARASANSAAGSGSFSFSGVMPGDYVLYFNATNKPYVSEWHADAATFAAATRITVTAGATVSGLVAQLTGAVPAAVTLTSAAAVSVGSGAGSMQAGWSTAGGTGSATLSSNSNWLTPVCGTSGTPDTVGPLSCTVLNGVGTYGRNISVAASAITSPRVGTLTIRGANGGNTVTITVTQASGAVAPTLTVTSPNGGESWTAGSAHAITWTSTGTIGNVAIDYSTNGGTTWASVVASTANDGSEAWTVPGVATTAALVRVSDASTPAVFDVSNAVFAVVPATPIEMCCGVGDTSGLIGYWKFNEIGGTTAADSFGSYPGTLTYASPAAAVPTFTAGQSSNAVGLSNGQYVTVPHTAALNITGDLTIALWVKPNSVTCSGADPAYDLVSKRSSNSPTPYEFMIGCGGSLRYEAWRGYYPNPTASTAAGLVTTGVWQHVAMTRSYSGTIATVTFYLNGVSVGSSSQDIGPTVASAHPVWIARDGYHTGYTSQGSYSGLMDEVAIFGRALSASELSNLHALTNAGSSYCGCDTTPDAFTFADQTGVALSTVATAAITVAGLNTGAPISIVGGAYAINGGAYTSASGTVSNGDTVTVRQTSSASYSTTTNATLTIGVVSDTFSVTTVPDMALALTSPNGGENWVWGSAHAITWTSTGTIGNVAIDYSTNGGTTWASVVASTANDGSEAWTVPGVATTAALVRISDASNPAVFDVSNAVMSIVGDVTEPNNTSATAATLPLGTTGNLLYESDSDVEWYKFFVPPSAAGQDLRVNVRVTSAYPSPAPAGWRSDIDFELLDGSLRVMGVAVSGSDNETLILHNAPSGWYYININYGTRDYADESGMARYEVTAETGSSFGVGYVSGRVVNGAGQGIGGVFVRLNLNSADWNVSFPMMTTAPDGTFTIAQAPGQHDVYFTGLEDYSQNQAAVNVVEEYYNDRRRSADADHVTVASGQTLNLGDVTLATGAIVTGQVVDGSGNPINFATVISYDTNGYASQYVRTGPSGIFTLVGVPPGGATIRASASAFAYEYYQDKPTQGTAAVLPTVAGETISGISLQLGAGGSIAGNVRDMGGAGIGGVIVRLFSALDSTFSRASVTSTATTGAFTFSGVMPGDYVLWFNATGTAYVSEWHLDAASFAAATRLTVTAGGAITGIVANLAAPLNADMAITGLTASPSPNVTAGANITYTISYLNNGPGTPGSTSVSSAVPGNTKFVSMRVVSGTGWNVIGTPPAVGGTGSIIWRKGSPGLGAASGETAQFEIVVSVDAGTAGGTVITNSANAYTIDGVTTDGVSANNTQSVTTTVGLPTLNADMAISGLTASPSPNVTAGGNITYTISYINNGPGTPGSTSVSNQTPANTTFVSMRVVSGTGWNVIGTPPAVGGTGNIIWRKGSPGLGAASGETAQFEIVVSVDAGTASGTVISNTSRAYSIDANTVDGVSGNNERTVTTTVAPAGTLTLTSPNGGETWTAGTSQTVTWTSTGTVGPVAIDYSLNGGTTWASVVASTANDGTEAWTLPNAGTTSALVRVSDTAHPSTIVDVSNAVFAIVVPAPTLGDVSPTSGVIGAAVTLTGTGFMGASAVTFNGVAATFTVVSATQITTSVPAGTTAGLVRVTTPGGTATSAAAFVVTNQSATRTLPACYVAGAPLTVTLNIGPAPSVLVYAAEEGPPATWTRGAISDSGTWDATTSKLKWGPFFDNTARAITYELTPLADAVDPVTFSGVASFDGIDVTLGGTTTLARCEAHPADANRDFRMVISDVTAYGSAWKRGSTWATPPNPIPIGYVTRAGYLWRSGEYYKRDNAQPCPTCWVILSATPLPLAEPVMSLSDIPTPHGGPWVDENANVRLKPDATKEDLGAAVRTGAATREVPAQYTPKVPLTVTMAIAGGCPGAAR